MAGAADAAHAECVPATPGHPVPPLAEDDSDEDVPELMTCSEDESADDQPTTARSRWARRAPSARTHDGLPRVVGALRPDVEFSRVVEFPLPMRFITRMVSQPSMERISRAPRPMGTALYILGLDDFDQVVHPPELRVRSSIGRVAYAAIAEPRAMGQRHVPKCVRG